MYRWCSYGGFQKYGYPQIIHLSRMFHCKPSILGYPIDGNNHIFSCFLKIFICVPMFFPWFGTLKQENRIYIYVSPYIYIFIYLFHIWTLQRVSLDLPLKPSIFTWKNPSLAQRAKGVSMRMACSEWNVWRRGKRGKRWKGEQNL